MKVYTRKLREDKSQRGGLRLARHNPHCGNNFMRHSEEIASDTRALREGHVERVLEPFDECHRDSVQRSETLQITHTRIGVLGRTCPSPSIAVVDRSAQLVTIDPHRDRGAPVLIHVPTLSVSLPLIEQCLGP